ncbi:MAG: UDP-N-acetylmuramoylalanyl-D-glutamyl-2,6-diaminopimelate--D-alanyl-D-alanine ligase [Inquilinaceae bacterium]
MTGPVLWTSADAAAATDGTVQGDWQATGVSIDSRSVSPGDLFVALVGPNFDGHAFVKDALAKGAVAAMIHLRAKDLNGDAPLLIVDDTMDGLNALATYARLRTSAQVVAVTGSLGKTGTKEALREALSAHGPTFASAGNLNNQWGVPLSLARMPADSAFGVFELGMNHPGEIAPLSHLVKPDVAVITTVEAVHLEAFDNVEGIADEKAAIFAGMTSAGTAVLNRENPHFARLVAHARTQGVGRVWSFGEQAGCEARLIDCSLHATCSAVNAVVLGEAVQYSLSLPGLHWVHNSLAVLLAARAVGADLTTAARALSRVQATKGRGERRHVTLGDPPGGRFLLIDESYNASPVSVAAALRTLGRSDPEGGGRRIAVLGDMLELGPSGAALHLELADTVREAGVDLLFACGPMMTGLHDQLSHAVRGGAAPDSATLAPLVVEAIQPGDVVMVKGSLGSRMATVTAALEALEAQRRDTSPHAANGT